MRHLAIKSVCLLAACSTIASESTNYHDVDLLLDSALFHDTAANPSPGDLELYLGYSDGQWRKDFLGYSLTTGEGRTMVRQKYNAMDHEGVIRSVSTNDGKLILSVDVTIHPDPSVPGGDASYQIELQRNGLEFAGKYQGTFKGKPVAGTVKGFQREKLWPAPVPGVVPPTPGEHPRLVFRKSDVETLRKRAQRPEGKAILALLEKSLAGPENMWHAAGYGLLYQVTGDAKYAAKAKANVDASLAGQVVNPDMRYGFTKPDGKLRAGPSYAAIGLAYDLCYDAWEPSFREGLARRIQDKIFFPEGVPPEGEFDQDLVFNTVGGQHSPRSNHYGAWNGGGGLAVLAIKGDPGTTQSTLERCHRIFLRRAKRALMEGYGDRAYFFEGHHCGRISSNIGLVPYLQALRTSEGLDMVANCEPAQWLLTKWIYEIVVRDGQVLNMQRGMYARDWTRFATGSAGNDFCQGFGILTDLHKPAVAWFYNNILEPGTNHTYDIGAGPHSAVYALWNWPLDVQEKNPAEVLPKALVDPLAGYCVFRSGWKDGNDIVATVYNGSGLLIAPGLLKRPFVWESLSNIRECRVENVEGGGAAIIRNRNATTVADMTGLCGANLLLVSIASTPQQSRDPVLRTLINAANASASNSPPKAITPAAPPSSYSGTRVHIQTISGNGLDFKVMTVKAGDEPQCGVEARDNATLLVVGERVIAIEGGKIRLEKRQAK